MKNYILIILLFFSNINDSKEAAIFLFIGGLFVSFLNYKKDKDERVMRFLNISLLLKILFILYIFNTKIYKIKKYGN